MIDRAPNDTIGHGPLLSKYGLLYNTTHRVLLCPREGCQVILHPDRIRDHIVKTHKEDERPLKDFDESIKQQYPEMTYQPAHPTTSVPIIFGLKAPSGTMSLICPVCFRGYSSTRAFNTISHAGKCEGGKRDAKSLSKSLVQRFSNDNQHGWFAVHVPEVDRGVVRGPVSRFELYRQQHSIVYENDGRAPVVPENYRNLEQFIRKDNWSTLFESCDLDLFLELTAKPKEEERFRDLQRQIHVFLDHNQAILRNGIPYGTRRDIGTRPS